LMLLPLSTRAKTYSPAEWGGREEEEGGKDKRHVKKSLGAFVLEEKHSIPSVVYLSAFAKERGKGRKGRR